MGGATLPEAAGAVGRRRAERAARGGRVSEARVGGAEARWAK